VLFLELVDTEGGFSWDEKPVFLDEGPDTVSQEIERGLQEVRGGLGKQSDDALVLVDFYLVVIDFLIFSLACDFMGLVEEFGGKREVEFCSEVLEEGEKFDSDVAVVLFFEKLEVRL
jgi:hypothetical protein